jgi:hypothetical protein
MRPPSAADVVAIWERGVTQRPLEWALTVLAHCTGEPRAKLAALGIGERDARLFAIHAHLFGARLDAYAECPRCAERLEYVVAGDDFFGRTEPGTEAAALALASGDVSLRLRLPDSCDLAAIGACADPAEARKLLAHRCVAEASRDGIPIRVVELSDATIDAISARLAAADPRADQLIDLICPSCAHAWQVALDVERFLWAKINALAKRLLREIHVLARAYGWSEHDILALSATRRAIYLEMAS